LSANRRILLTQNISFQENSEGKFDGKESSKLSDGQLVMKYVDSAKKPKKSLLEEAEFTEYHENTNEEETKNLKSMEISKAYSESHNAYQATSTNFSRVNYQMQQSGSKQRALHENSSSELVDRPHLGEGKEELEFRTKEEWEALDKKNLIVNDRKLLPRVGEDEHIQLIESAEHSQIMKDRSISRLTTEKKERVTEELVGTEAKEGTGGAYGRDLSLVGYTNNMTPNSRETGQLTPFSRLESTQPKEAGFRPEYREEGVSLRFKDIEVDKRDYTMGSKTVQISESRQVGQQGGQEAQQQSEGLAIVKREKEGSKEVEARMRIETEGNSQKVVQQSSHQTQVTTNIQEAASTKEESSIQGGQAYKIPLDNQSFQRSQNGVFIAGLGPSQGGDSGRGLTGYAQTVQTLEADSDSSRVRINRPGAEYQLTKQTLVEGKDTSSHRITTDGNLKPSEGQNRGQLNTYSPSQISHGSPYQSGKDASPQRKELSAISYDLSRTTGQKLHLNNSAYELHESTEGQTKYYHPMNPTGQLFPTNRNEGLNHNYNSNCYLSSDGRYPTTNTTISTKAYQDTRRSPVTYDGGSTAHISNQHLHYVQQHQQNNGASLVQQRSSIQSQSRGNLLPENFDFRRLQDNITHSPSREQRRNRLDSPEKRELSPILPESSRPGFKFLPDLHSSQWVHPGHHRGGHHPQMVLQNSKYPSFSHQSSNTHLEVKNNVSTNLSQYQKSLEQRGLTIRPSQTTTHNERNESSTYVSYQSANIPQPASVKPITSVHQIENKNYQTTQLSSLGTGKISSQQPMSEEHMKQYNFYTSNLSSGNSLQVQGGQAGLRTNVMETQYSNMANQRKTAQEETPQKQGLIANIDGTAQSKLLSVEFTPMYQSVSSHNAQYSGLRVLGTETVKRAGSNEKVHLVHQGEDFKVYQYFTKTKSSIVVKDSYSSNQGPETVNSR
jgi:hypothetical protein